MSRVAIISRLRNAHADHHANLVTWPVAVWFSVLVVVLVPLAAAIRERDPHELRRFRGELLNSLAVCGFLGLVVKLISNAVLVPWMALNGLVLANAVTYGFNTVLLGVMSKRSR